MRFVLSADWHTRGIRPRCRLDEDWLQTQENVLTEIVQVTKAKNAGLFVIGDITDKALQPLEIINMLISTLKPLLSSLYILPGNHDLLYHVFKNENKSSYGVLRRIFMEIMNIDSVGSKAFGEPLIRPDSEILFMHELVFPNDAARPMKNLGKTAEELLEKYPKAKWVFVGDYHHHYHFEKDGRHVVNPGSIMRQAADMIDYKPVVYYIDTEKSIVEVIELKADIAGKITDDYIVEEHERNDRIESFVASIKEKGKVAFNFIANLKYKLTANKVDKNTKDFVNEILEEI